LPEHQISFLTIEETAMLYDDLIDISKVTEARTALICARLHLRNGKKRLAKGFSTKAIAALYDAVWFGMLYYVVRHKGCASYVEHTELWDAAGVFHALSRAGVFEDQHAFNRLSLLVERALWQQPAAVDAHTVIVQVEEMLTKLGVTSLKKSMGTKSQY
jgi:hypothetical protein